MPRVQVRLSQDQHDSWAQAAALDGVAVGVFVRRAVEERIAGRTTRAIARAVVNELLPEIEQLNERLLARNAPQNGDPGANPPVFVPLGPVFFDPTCYDAELHRHGVICNGCGGSMKA